MNDIYNHSFSFHELESNCLGEIDFYKGQTSLHDIYPYELFPDTDYVTIRPKQDEVECDTQELDHDSGTDFDAQELERDFNPMYEEDESSAYREPSVDALDSSEIQSDITTHIDSLEINCAVLWNLGYFGGWDEEDGSDLSFLVAE
jgi:hypothetical protein